MKEKMLDEATLVQIQEIAMEWGFKAREKGWNIDRAKIEFKKHVYKWY